MLELRLLENVPPQAAPIAFVRTKPISVPENVSLIDLSRREGNALAFFGESGTVELDDKPGASRRSLFSDAITLGNRSVLSSALIEPTPLFFAYRMGRSVAFELVADSGSIDVSVTETTITINAQPPITLTGKSTREVVEEINAQSANNVSAFLIYPAVASLETGSFTATTSGVELFFSDYHRVYAPAASTSDLIAARETIRNLIEVLVDDEKSSELRWDIEVTAYEENGFLVTFYADRKPIEGRTYKVRYPSIDRNGVIENHHSEVLNLSPYLLEDRDYTVTEGDQEWRIASDVDAAPALGVFGTGTVSVTSTEISVTAESMTITTSYVGKTLETLASELAESFVGTRFSALVSRPALEAGDLETQTDTVFTSSGLAVHLVEELHVLYGAEGRLQALPPYNEPGFSPWYPRIRKGRFSELNYVDEIGYGQDFGASYGGSIKSRYTYGLADYDDQTFTESLGAPYRSIVQEEPLFVSSTILRTRRFPLEGHALLTLKDGANDLTSSIEDIDLEQGFIYLSEPVRSSERLALDYVYEERSLIYKGIDINTVNHPELIGKHIGIYIIPETVAGLIYEVSNGYAQHIVRDSLEDIEETLDALAFSDGTLVHPFLLGVYQILPTEEREDIRYLPVGIRGGGVREDVTPQGEARFVADHGFWDGEPFEADQAILLEVPARLEPTPSSTVSFTIDPEKTEGFMEPRGLFTREEIERTADRWIAPGTLLIVENLP